VVPLLTSPMRGRSLLGIKYNSVLRGRIMKDLKMQTRPEARIPVRSVSLQIRDYQVTVKVRSSVPQAPSTGLRSSFR
jgi:hypothetical protein